MSTNSNSCASGTSRSAGPGGDQMGPADIVLAEARGRFAGVYGRVLADIECRAGTMSGMRKPLMPGGMSS